MPLTLDFHNTILFWCHRWNRLLYRRHGVLLVLCLLLPQIQAYMYEGDACKTKFDEPGVCTLGSKCSILEEAVNAGRISNDDIVSCGGTPREEIVCCPSPESDVLTSETARSASQRKHYFGTTPTKDSTAPAQVGVTALTPTQVAERPAVKACRRYEANMSPSLTKHIVNGLPADEGEYPHMAAIGFSQIGEDISSGRYDWDCGGTLIESRFVLTAAHCVNSRERRPVVVRLGVVNVTDPSGTTVPIKTVHIHNDYRGSSKYNDIAILELEQDLDFGKLSNVYPTCLYTDLKDPGETEKLYVTGWGSIDVITRTTSEILLHAVVSTVPIDKCNETYFRDGLINRKLQFGLDKRLLCAYDNESDACQGDSGGPLQWSIDKAFPKYRVVGIISAGLSCGTQTPALYTRVATYLDYIESIVWPDSER